MAKSGVRIGVIAGAGVLAGFALTVLLSHEPALPEGPAPRPLELAQPEPAPEPRAATPPAAPAAPPAPTAREVEESEWRTAPVAEFKRALYELDIDSVDRLDELDAFVATGGADPRSFWDTDWTGIDDWKDEPDDFRLERTEDGSLVFVPGEQTRRAYTFFETMNEYAYDEATGEFVYETEFYGKPITNIVKFLRKDVMVMLVISGEKVDMSLYQLNAEPADGR